MCVLVQNMNTLPILLSFFVSLDRGSYDYHLARRRALSRWLVEASSKTIEHEVASAGSSVSICTRIGTCMYHGRPVQIFIFSENFPCEEPQSPATLIIDVIQSLRSYL